MELVGGWSVNNVAYPVWFLTNNAILILRKINIGIAWKHHLKMLRRGISIKIVSKRLLLDFFKFFYLDFLI